MALNRHTLSNLLYYLYLFHLKYKKEIFVLYCLTISLFGHTEDFKKKEKKRKKEHIENNTFLHFSPIMAV